VSDGRTTADSSPPFIMMPGVEISGRAAARRPLATLYILFGKALIRIGSARMVRSAAVTRLHGFITTLMQPSFLSRNAL